MIPERTITAWRELATPTLRPADGSGAPLAPVPAQPGHLRRSVRASESPRFLYLLWLMLLFDPHWWVVSKGLLWVRHFPTALFAILALLLLLRFQIRQWYPQLLLLVAFAIGTWPFALNPAYAEGPAKALVLYWLFAIGTLSLVRTPAQSVPILLLGVFQYAWWGVLGAKDGMVVWHPVLGNYDGFGPVMAIGLASTLHFGLAARARPMRYFAFAVAALCGAGLVSSFARGAFLAAGAVLAFMLCRSPDKRAAAAGVAFAVAVVAFAGIVLFGEAGTKRAAGKGVNTERSFFAEIGTISRDFNAGTGEDRRVLWKAAWDVFREHPIVGVGAENFGPFAATHFRPGMVGGVYGANPARLYDRKLHSGYFQSLCEFGAIGSLLFVALLVDFWKRNAALRTAPYRAAWEATTGGAYDLRWLALGLEAGMVAFCASAVFYNQLFEPWLYVLLTTNLLLQTRLKEIFRPRNVPPGVTWRPT